MLAKKYNAFYLEKTNSYMMDCDIKKKKNLVFDFGGFQINIPLRHFLHQEDSSKVCYWTMVSTDGK